MKIVAVCGLGMGSSMMLKMSIDDVLKAEGIKAKLESVDVGSAKGMNADIYVLSQELEKNAKDFSGKVIVIKNLTDTDEIRDKLLAVLNKE